MKTITKISTQKKQGRYNVDLNGHFAFGIAESVLVKYGLAKGRELDDETIQRIKYDDEIAKALHVAVNYLGHTLRTVHQVQKKLHDNDVDVTIQDQVIAKLKEQSYLDDLNYAKHYVATKKHIAPKGPLVVAQELKQAGVTEDEIDIALRDYTYEEQLAIAEKLGAKFAKNYQRQSSRAKQQKVIQALLNKGFSYDIAQIVIERFVDSNSNEVELDNIMREATKLWHRYRHEVPSQRKYRTKNNLYAKGYTSELIDQSIDKLMLDES